MRVPQQGDHRRSQLFDPNGPGCIGASRLGCSTCHNFSSSVHCLILFPNFPSSPNISSVVLGRGIHCPENESSKGETDRNLGNCFFLSSFHPRPLILSLSPEHHITSSPRVISQLQALDLVTSKHKSPYFLPTIGASGWYLPRVFNLRVS